VVVDLLVTGLGLGTGCEVHAGDRQTWQWHPKGHNGDRAWSACSVIPAKTFPAGRKWWRWFLKAAGAVRAASILLIHRGWPRPEVTAGRAPGTRKASSGCAADAPDVVQHVGEPGPLDRLPADGGQRLPLGLVVVAPDPETVRQRRGDQRPVLGEGHPLAAVLLGQVE
jgi:hypothetical protein